MIGNAIGAGRYIRTKYRLFRRVGMEPRHALARAFHSLFNDF
ncbi:hypothetical protein [Pseudoduganella lurida]|nr:hypothetical protein [Pseudoduganella lurida]